MTDPDTSMQASGEAALPMVGRRVGNRGAWLFGGGLAIAAVALFTALEARRSTLSSPTVTVPREAGSGTISAPPDLVIPPAFGPEPLLPMVLVPQPDPAPDLPQPAIVPRRVQPDVFDTIPPPPRQPPQVDPQQDFRPILRRPQPDFTPPADSDPDRQRTTRLANPSYTVPKGAVIHAVLETALDSTRPGAARAIVSRDVSSFDGTRVLVPKGSKLIGEYEADLARGQNRALIQWQRLMLPDGTLMNVDSPSADPLGRAGVKGKVNTHFLERFGGAILQSVLDIGVQVATREVGGDTVVLNVPNNAQNQVTSGDDVRPTLKIRHGSSVAVFVARDLDFSGMGS